MLKAKSQAIIVVLFILLFDSCKFKQFDLENAELGTWKPTAAIPLFETNISVDDMMASADATSIIQVDDNDGFLSLVYRTSILEFSAEELLQISGVQRTVNFQVAGGVFPPSGEVLVTKSLEIPFGNGTDRIYEIWLKSGFLTINTINSSLYNASISLSSTQIAKNGNPIHLEVGLGNSLVEQLCEYHFKFNANGEISVLLQAKITGTPGQTYSSGEIQADILPSLMKGKKAYLQIKPRKVLTLQDSFNIPFFKLKNLNGAIEFLDPKLKFVSVNSFGGSALLEVEQMRGVAESGASQNVQFEPGSNKINISRPSYVGDVKIESVDLKVAESFSEVLKISPKVFHYQNAVYLNDDGSADTNFVLDTSRIVFHSQIELPLQLKFRRFDFGPIVPVDMSDLFLTDFEFVKFQFETINKFPIELRFQLIFMDANENVIDSLFSNGRTLFKSGVVEANGRVEKDVVQKNEIILNKEKAQALQLATKMRVIFGFNTYDNGSQWARFYDDYRIGMKFRVLAKGSLNQ